MSPLKSSLLIAILACVSACGRQVVEFRIGDQADAGTDGSTDAPTDAPIALRPAVTATMPSSGASGVSLATLVTATFSKPMNAGTLTTATFILRQGATTMTGPVTINTAGTTATLTPTAPLTPGLIYIATITTGAQDGGGLALAADYTWMFTAAPNVLPPTVTSTMPASGALNIAIAVSPTATFSKAMNGTTINATTFTLAQGLTPIAGAVTLNGATNTATFNPTLDLTVGLVYTATITTGAQDTGGLALGANHTWMFTTGPSVALPPTVTSTTPLPGAINVALNTSPTALFDQTMNGATITALTFTLVQGITPVLGTVTLNGAGTTATFNPTVDLTTGLLYTATITTGAQGTNGMALAANHTWMFSAGTLVQPPTVTSTMPLPGAINVALNTSPTALFDQAMNPTTITALTFTLAQGLTPVLGTVTLDLAGTTATFDPTVDLTAGLVYAATITTGAQGTSGMALAANHTWMFTAATLVQPPTVTSTTPLPGAINVALSTSPTALFDQAMNPTTITAVTFTLAQGLTPVLGTVTLNVAGTTATFDPTVDLTAGLVYTATITTGAQGSSGMALATAHSWMFTAGTVVLPPMVASTTPLAGALNVALSTSPTALFDQAMNPTTITALTFTLAQGLTPVLGTVTLDLAGTTATFDPTVDLTTGLVYTATITTGAQGTSGIALATAHSWMFTAGTALGLTVVSTMPLPNAANVGISVSPTATFSQPMNAVTINATTFTVAQGLTPIVGVVTYDTLTSTAMFDPTVDLAPGAYTATITTGAEDMNGAALATAHTWMFTVGASTACVVPPIVLGTSGAFAVLAGSTVTNTGPSMITGDLGVWPLTAITGFPPGILTGSQFAGVPTAMTAQGDLTTAYNDAAGRTLCLTSITGDLGGLTLAPGLYKSTSFLEITTADLVLDAMGDANAVWIFSMASELTVASSRQVTIIGGGSAANVYWQVGSSAVLGTGAMFKGTIMADQAISLATGAVIDGRALARIAAVTLDSSTVVRP